jgi:hypothetical protein
MISESYLAQLEANLQRFGCIFERDARVLLELIRKDIDCQNTTQPTQD